MSTALATDSTRSLKQAVLYLRVSTQRQTNTAIDIDADGLSVATQREACLAKAQSLNAGVVAQFVEPGSSAQSIEKRPVFKELLAYLEDHRGEIDYVIVYMRSRAFRNSIDAAITKRALSMFGIRIISCKEDFGTGPVADAMETVSDAFNELQVKQNGEDIKQKLRHKALNGGTISRAKLGYLNTRAEHEGRLFNTISIDEKRAPLVLKAFQLYATGDYPLDRLEITMSDLGLTSRPSARWPQEQPVSDSHFHRMLADPYYAGWVVVDGKLVPGRHPAIVSQDLFDRVQDVRAVRSADGNRDRKLQHYLKGMVFCQRCHEQGRTSRLIYTQAKGRNGQIYSYFMCRARQERNCDLPHLPDWQVEESIERHYATLQVPDDFASAVREQLKDALANEQQLVQDTHDKLTKQLAKLDGRENRLIDLAADGLLSRDKILERSNAIQLERTRIQASLANTTAELAIGAERLLRCLDLVSSPATLYRDAPDATRCQLNATFYHRFYLNDDPLTVTSADLKPPFDEIHDASIAYERYKALTAGSRTRQPEQANTAATYSTTKKRPHQMAETLNGNQTPVLADIFSVDVSSKRVLVGPVGLEPTTYGLKVRSSAIELEALAGPHEWCQCE